MRNSNEFYNVLRARTTSISIIIKFMAILIT